MAVGWQLLIVALFASFVGLSELVTRFKSDPGSMLRDSPAAWSYVITNAVAGVMALVLIRAMGWFSQSPHADLWRILVASFGALAFFRTSLFIAKVGDSNVGVGPSVVLGALLEAFDRQVDRNSATKISKDVETNGLGALDPDRVMFTLPVLCLALMQNFPSGDQAQLGAELSKLRQTRDLTEQAKMYATVIQLSKYLGADLVTRVLSDASELFKAPALAPPSVSDVTALLAAARKLTEADTPPGTSESHT